MNNWKYDKDDWETIRMSFWLFVLMLMILVGMTSCDITRKVQKEQRNTQQQNNTDSGQVAKNEKEKKQQEEWWRETINILRNKKDTNIIYGPDVNVPGVSVPPAQITIIREGGTKNTEEKETNTDSIWMQRLNSITEAIKSKDKEGETNVLPWDRIIAVGVVLLLLVVLLLWYVDKRMSKVTTLISSLKNQ